MQVKVLTTNEPEAQIKEHHYFEELPPRIQKAIEDSYTGVNLVYEYDTSKSVEYPNLPSFHRGNQSPKPAFLTWGKLMMNKE